MLGVSLLFVIVIKYGERVAFALILLRLAYKKHTGLVVQVLKQALSLPPGRVGKEPLLYLQIINGRYIVVRHVAGLFGAQILSQPPVGMILVHDNQRIVLFYGHVICGGLFIIEQRNIVGLLVHLVHFLAAAAAVHDRGRRGRQHVNAAHVAVVAHGIEAVHVQVAMMVRIH